MKKEAVVLGASRGGLTALQRLFSRLPANFGLPLLVVQHRAPSTDDFLASYLNEASRLTVKEAEDKEPIRPGYVYLAPANYHLLVESNKTVSLSIDAKQCYARPSIDILFETAADVYRSGLVAVILTGANEDGTAGLKQVKAGGGLTIAQDPTTAEAEVMPLSAVEAGVVEQILSLTEIATFLNQLLPAGEV